MIDGPDTQAWLNAQNDKPGDQTGYYFANDELEAGKFNEFYPTQASASGGSAAPWWASLATYGATRAIDAAVGPKQTGTNGQGASYAGQNGQTYGAGTHAPLGSNTLILLIAAGAALLLL